MKLMTDAMHPLYHDFAVKTPAGLVVTQDAFESMVKAESRRQKATEANKTPVLFSPYALYQNMQVYGAREKPVGTPRFEDLYLAAEKSFIDRIIIQARIDQSKMVWQRAVEGRVLGYKVVHDRHDDPKFKPTDKILEQCAEMEALIADPTPTKFRDLYPHQIRIHDTLKDLVSRLVRSELIIDRKVLYRYKRRDGKGYGAFHWLPGATIKPVHETIRDWQRKYDPKGTQPNRIAAEKMSIQYGVDFFKSSFIQVLDGIPICGFTEEEIAIHISNPSDRENRNGYGESRLEISLDLTAAVLYAWRYNQELFKTNYPEAILTVAGDFDKAGLEAFKHQLIGEAGGVGQAWRLPVIATTPGADMANFKLESHKLRDTPKDMLFDQMLRMIFNLKAAAFGTHSSTLNLGMESGGGTSSPLSSHSPDAEIDFAKEQGFKPHLLDMAAWLTDSIVKPTYPELRLIIDGLDEQNEREKLEVMTEKGRSYVTTNELRVMDGMEPLGFWCSPEEYKSLSDDDKKKFDENPYNWPSDAPKTSYIQTFNSAKQQEQMMQMQQQGGDDQGGQGEDDGNDNPWGEGYDDSQDQTPNPWGEQDDEQQPAMQKSQRRKPEVKYLRITIE